MRDEHKPVARPGTRQVMRRSATFDLDKIDSYRRVKGNVKTELKIGRELRVAGFNMTCPILMTIDKRRLLVIYEQDVDIAESVLRPRLVLP